MFKAIAAKWQKKSVEEVTQTDRQQVKQIIYGILYGMGVKKLSEELGVTIEDAGVFISTFMDTYPGVKKFIEATIENCKKNGHITTLKGRRRYLPHIVNSNQRAMAEAERQAVNSTIQGSASDIIKKAMIDIDRELCKRYPSCRYPIRRSSKEIKNMTRIREGAHFILQLHDELYYEVSQKDLVSCASLIKNAMEKAVELDVAFPVKVKIGQTWGELTEMHVE